ncbi:MAG: hypothetical protein A3B91_01270 [Candidatus Yanofskybacteria bacterium RIFCSPHIGHO2_02_FULL_41_29]|uniref:4Fe4S-binding SPASM domain-containing protein n=1 Tax=Candidatus Yanofskybacteria bacterium RIFCSPHIGHO2_01_FULL_41_53 TaxID=1802663 RepID=A0A1F8EJ82_9BACT|nr:MAG: hypothetical protein A2650_02060 [Candidatus Yanofskybacteria bacterium RIFCSPHIGHO2_01_FULL_41_53]OGN10250.1 MAG: hypothetical protein A3B91_01270 [Candidatus Yanofskybacteria bacterium RIFCSPHIGHO2_02_FULL_41_29]OGN18311.1 MAG: hypothetical protein A3F48_04475 [Candidatus Yanofskybacteria bacterium RIFCSPHIGHO2_12_FULL_41_9]OGN22691.1 MAG: hypothetical protein A2916_02215 [Candidatus Yanofskybacteria bacterium RIFCSPLOWO2_01_FULL_41_67]OGN30446.1 MAG: hypothetical protein A3H54_00245 
MNPDTGIMTEETFSGILSRIKHLQFRVIVLYHGGEPLLNPRFAEMIKRVRPYTKFIKTVTNGSILTQRRIDEILASDLDLIEVSIDGDSPEENDQIRKNAKCEKIITAVKAIIDTKRRLGLDRPKVNIGNVRIPGSNTNTNLPPDVPEFLKKAFVGYEQDIMFRMYYALVWANMIGSENKIPENNYCDNVVNTITVRHNGDVVPCCYDLTSSMVMGNLLTESLESIWNNDRYLKLRAAIANFQPPAPCQNCLVLYPSRHLKSSEISLV